jgi:hypothetical protein
MRQQLAASSLSLQSNNMKDNLAIHTDAESNRPTKRAPVLAVGPIFALAILALALCSCADFKGFHLKPAADGDRDGFGHGYVSGSGDPS